MFLLSDVITYIRRIIKSPSNSSITDSLLIDYINRFYINDVDARIQLFDLKKKYSFMTTPGVDQYNTPLYDLQIESPNQYPQNVNFYPVYQGFLEPCYINGVQINFQTQKRKFFGAWPNVTQNLQAVGIGSGVSNYTLQIPILPQSTPANPPFNAILRGHVDISGIIATGNNVDPPITPVSPSVVPVFNTSIPVTSVNAAVYITTLDAAGRNMIVSDSGQFFSDNNNMGLLMNPGKAPLGNTGASNGYFNTFTITNVTLGATTLITAANTLSPGQRVTIQGVVGTTELNGNIYTVISATAADFIINVDSLSFTLYVSDGTASTLQNYVNYLTGEINVTFPQNVPVGNNINVQCYFFQSGLPRSMLYYNNVITLRSVPAKQYLVELDAYMTPAAFLSSSDALPFGYMSEYIARGAARKILSDTNDVEQFQFYEPLFHEQEQLVWKRSQRQWTATRTESLYSQGLGYGSTGFNNLGGGTL